MKGSEIILALNSSKASRSVSFPPMAAKVAGAKQKTGTTARMQKADQETTELIELEKLW
jgi:hypothetical protein